MQIAVETDAVAGSVAPSENGAAVLTVEDLWKAFPTSGRRGEVVHAVRGVGFAVREGQVFTLLGPSGCGKTTTLRLIAGIERPDRGRITLGGTAIFDSETRRFVAPNERNLGMVFQSYAIWPHMSVLENVAFPLAAAPRRRRSSRSEVKKRATEALEVVGLSDLLHRPSTELSGGQQQRVALARALVSRPSVVLLDEPLSNLDASLREQMRTELRRLQRELRLTVVLVTHDQSEALGLSDQIAVMRDGKMLQIGAPDELYEHPNSVYVAESTGPVNRVDGRVLRRDGQECEVLSDLGSIWAQNPHDFEVGAAVSLIFRPEHVGFDRSPESAALPTSACMVVRGAVTSCEYRGAVVEQLVSIGDVLMRCRADSEHAAQVGETVTLSLPSQSVFALPL